MLIITDKMFRKEFAINCEDGLNMFVTLVTSDRITDLN